MKKDPSIRQEPKASAPRLRGWKRWAFPLIAMVFIPGLFFLLLEGGLRLIQYGFPTQFLIKRTVNGETVYTDNRQYGWRFFPKQVARRPAEIVLPAKKPENAFRVFVLGESAAMGDPDNAFGIPRMLEVMLAERFPGKKIEVVNAAMTGISSHIIQDIARDCARFQPDCFVVYMGNNEAIGPYGPGTVFASFSRNLALTRSSINARSLRTSQLLDGIIRSRSKNEQPEGWGGLRVFMKSQMHPTDERLGILGQHFEANLKTICEAGRKAGAKLVLCTVASSTADCSPFASLNNPSLTLEQKNTWDAKWSQGNKLESAGDQEGAWRAYQEAEAIDASYAELHYRKGKVQRALGRSQEAQVSFNKARDLDALRFRTATDLNDRVKQLAQSFPAPDVALADVVKRMEEDSGGKGIGSGHFVDHVHFNFHGNYVAAREIAEAVSRLVLGADSSAGQKMLTEEECAQRLAFTPWDDLIITEHMIQRFNIPPFNAKSDFKERIQELEKHKGTLKDASNPTALRAAVATYAKALERKKGDSDLMRSLAELYMELEQPAEEIKYRQALYDASPYDQDRKAFLAEAQARGGKPEEAETLAREVIKADPTQVIARIALAIALERKGALHEAMTEYQEVLRWRPDMVDIQQKLARLERGGANPVYPSSQPMAGAVGSTAEESKRLLQLGEELLTNGKTAEGMEALRTAIRLNPQLAEAYLVLAGVFVHQGKPDEAIGLCKEGIRMRPDFVELHSNLGALLTDLNRLAEARTHLEAAVRLNANHEDARLNLALNLTKDKRHNEALPHFEFFIQKHPNEAEVHLQMGWLYEGNGSWEKAAASYRQALRVHPANEQYQSYLAWVLATSPADHVRNGKEALELAQAAAQGGRKEPYIMDSLAAAFAEIGQYGEAVKAAEDALALARTANDPGTVEEIGRRIDLYKSSKPYRSSVTTQVTE